VHQVPRLSFGSAVIISPEDFLNLKKINTYAIKNLTGSESAAQRQMDSKAHTIYLGG